jgi:hypothetical protein
MISEAEFPADWRERLLAILTSEGISQPPYISRLKLVMSDILKIMTLAIMAILVFISVLYPLVISHDIFHLSDAVTGAIILPLLFFAWPAFLILVIWPRGQRLGRKFRMHLWIGQSATDALRGAKHPPVLYLRSFKFDAVAATPPKWLQRLFTFGLGAAAADTPEMSLVLTSAQYAPVLAIGRPHESDPPPGALRFQVAQEKWQSKVEELAPLCQLIIWATGHSKGLRWEIEHLVQTVPPKRLLLWLHVRAGGLTGSQRRSEWAAFVDAYRDVFPNSLPRELNRTRFIAFDDDWTPISIPSRQFPSSLNDRLHFLDMSTFGLRSFLTRRMQH